MNFLKRKVLPFAQLARWHKPSPSLLLFLPGSWSIAASTYALNFPIIDAVHTTTLFAAGAFLMRGAGCTINDLWDKDLDKHVERTQSRPLASGALSPFQAICFLGLQLSAGLGILLQLNTYSIVLGALSLPLVVIYPLMKRVTFWPQLVLGFTFNWGALLGWSAMANAMSWTIALPLYASGVCWTLVYDTIYALQDRKDDVKVGIKSTALLSQGQTKTFLSTFAVGQVSLLTLVGILNGHGPFFYLISVGGSAIHLIWQIAMLKTDSVKDAWDKFASNIWLGALVLSGFWTDILYRRKQIKSPANAK